MTKKIYYRESFRKEFTANIVSYIEEDGEYHIVLDQTSFYPEGGGQPADRGIIGSNRVKYVYEKEGQVFHVVEKLPEEKENVNCKIDWDRRFDFMQQHTGQHLLSSLLESICDAKTVGFHLSEDTVTVDTDITLTKESLRQVEERLNEIIYQNKEVIVEFPDPGELEQMSLRKEPAVAKEDTVRIIRIEDYDISPCGGTHLKKTGQIGIVDIIDFENYKGGMRISFVCGKRALKDYNFKNMIIASSREILSVPDSEITSEIKRLKEELDNKESYIENLKDELLDYRIEELINEAEEVSGYRIIKNVYKNEDYSDVRLLANKLVDYEDNIVIFGQKGEGNARMILAKSSNIDKLDMNEMIGDIMSLLDGNGGGNEYFAQGGGSKTDKLTEAVETAYQKVKEIQ